MILLLTAIAGAASVSATYCVEYNVDHGDLSTGDFFNDTTVPAWGAKIEFDDGSTVVGDYADWDGSTPGCLTYTLDDTKTYSVHVRRKAYIDGNYVVVKSTGGGIYSTTLESSHTPTDSETYEYDIGPYDPVRIMAPTSWAAKRRNGGISGETFEFRDDGCDGSGGNPSCYNPSTNIAWINPSNADSKYSIVHEMGHMLSNFANDLDGGNVNYGADNDDCGGGYDCCGPLYGTSGHNKVTKEYQSAAAIEGIADFYAALSFNKNNESDCKYESEFVLDFNQDGTIDGDDVAVFGCEGGVPSAGVDAHDYFGDFCIGGSGEDENRGVQYDFLRHLWDFNTDKGRSYSVILDIWDCADPDTWNAAGSGSGSNYPAERLQDAADDTTNCTFGSVGTDWANTSSSNGADR